MVKQEMARVNIDILGISELKWTGMGEFNSDDHYIYYCGQESLRRNRLAVTLEPKKVKSITVSIVSPFISHEVMGLDAMILVF